MKTIKISIFTLTYTIDFPVYLLFFGVLLDIISTSIFVGLGIGREANIILRDLISVSIWFIPVYLLTSNAVFVPLLPGLLRKTLSYTFGLVHGLLGLNNFSLILFRNAFLVGTIGFDNLNILFILFGLSLFAYFMNEEKMNRKEVVTSSLKLVLYLLFLVLIQYVYSVIPTFF